MIHDISLLIRLLFRIWVGYAKFCIKLFAVIWMVVIAITVFDSCAHADGWFCDTQAGQRNDDVYSVCGIGESMNEGSARSSALRMAIEEFNTLCELSSDCKDRGRTLEPKRTECHESRNGVVKCVRLLEVRLYEK